MNKIKELLEIKEDLENIIDSNKAKLDKVEYDLYQELLKHHLFECEHCKSLNVAYVYPFTCDRCKKTNN